MAPIGSPQISHIHDVMVQKRDPVLGTNTGTRLRISNPGKQADRITDLSFAILQGNTHVSSSGPGLSHRALLYPSMLWGSHKTKAQSPSHHVTVGMSLAPESQFPATALFPLPPHSVLQPVLKGGRKIKRENTKPESDRTWQV